MILANINSFEMGGLSPELKKFIEILKTLNNNTPLGRTELEGGAFYSVSDTALSDRSERKFEYHKRFIDIQFVIDGIETMEYTDINAASPITAFNDERDIGFAEGEGALFTLRSGDLAIFFPEDAHKPCIGEGCVRKVVVKIPVNH